MRDKELKGDDLEGGVSELGEPILKREKRKNYVIDDGCCCFNGVVLACRLFLEFL